MKSQITTASIAVVLLGGMQLHAEVPSVQKAFQAFKMCPWIADAVIRAQGQPTKIPSLNGFRAQNSHLPLLTGTEGIDIHAFRSSVQAGNRYTEFTSFQEVLDELEFSTAPLGESTTFQFVGAVLGWANLKMNWARATLLGNRSDATRFLAEIQTAEEHLAAGGGLEYDETGATFPASWPGEVVQLTTFGMHFVVIGAADVLDYESAYLPDSLDPQGYIRQQLTYTARALHRVSDMVRTLGEMSTTIHSLLPPVVAPPPPPLAPPPSP